MPNSGTVASGAQATATQYNNLRADVLDAAIGHKHDGTDGVLLPKAKGAQYGDGSDGDVTISGNTTLTRDMFYNSLTVNGGVILATAGFRVNCRTSLTNRGTIRNNGGDGQNGASGVSGAAGAASGGGTSGAMGPAGGAGSNLYGAPGQGGYIGGPGGTGGGGSYSMTSIAGGTTSAPAANTEWRSEWAMSRAMYRSGPNWMVLYSGASGGGGCGDSPGTGRGGGGGGGGGWVILAAALLDNAGGVIQANGGNGGSATYGNCGGGGAGGGGVIVLIADRIVAGTEQALAGTPGAKSGTGVVGGNGGAGAVYRFLEA